MINFLVVEGNAGREPELRTTQKGIKVATYSIATSKKNSKDEENPITNWYNVVAWGDQADLVMANIHKGTRVLVNGEFRTRSYEDKDGKTAYVSEIMQNSFWLAPKKTQNNEFTYDEAELPF